MNILWFILVIVMLLGAIASFVWVALILRKGHRIGVRGSRNYNETAEADVERIFNDEFREELRNRGRLHFEKIIKDYATFSKQDLQLTASELNNYMQEEVRRVLENEFAQYEKSVEDAGRLVIEEIHKTQQTVQHHRENLASKLQDEFESEKKIILAKFEENMGRIVSQYVLEAIGGKIDINNQMDFISQRLEDNKKAILKDIINSS